MPPHGRRRWTSSEPRFSSWVHDGHAVSWICFKFEVVLSEDLFSVVSCIFRCEIFENVFANFRTELNVSQKNDNLYINGQIMVLPPRPLAVVWTGLFLGCFTFYHIVEQLIFVEVHRKHDDTPKSLNKTQILSTPPYNAKIPFSGLFFHYSGFVILYMIFGIFLFFAVPPMFGLCGVEVEKRGWERFRRAGELLCDGVGVHVMCYLFGAAGFVNADDSDGGSTFTAAIGFFLHFVVAGCWGVFIIFTVLVFRPRMRVLLEEKQEPAKSKSKQMVADNSFDSLDQQPLSKSKQLFRQPLATAGTGESGSEIETMGVGLAAAARSPLARRSPPLTAFSPISRRSRERLPSV